MKTAKWLLWKGRVGKQPKIIQMQSNINQKNLPVVKLRRIRKNGKKKGSKRKEDYNNKDETNNTDNAKKKENRKKANNKKEEE